MDFLRNLFSPRLYPPTKQLVDSYLKQINFSAKTDICPLYISKLNEYTIKGQSTKDFLIELVIKLNNNPTITETIKLLTIIHCFIVERDYNRQQICGLEQLEIGMKIQQNQQWFENFSQAYIAYLMKLPSLADLYKIAQRKGFQTDPKEQLTHIYRIINQARLLFPHITKAVNVIGRYQAGKFSQFRQLYRIISVQLVNVYGYLRYLVGQIISQYRIYNPVDLRCFLKTIPEMELICDKIEDLLVNKYIKGKKVNAKIEFKEENVAELEYYLQYEYKQVKLID